MSCAPNGPNSWTFAEPRRGIGSLSLGGSLKIPADLRRKTPLLIFGTAGMRSAVVSAFGSLQDAAI